MLGKRHETGTELLCRNKCSNKNAKVLGINKDENRTLTTYFSDDYSVCFGTFSVCIFLLNQKKK